MLYMQANRIRLGKFKRPKCNLKVETVPNAKMQCSCGRMMEKQRERKSA